MTTLYFELTTNLSDYALCSYVNIHNIIIHLCVKIHTTRQHKVGRLTTCRIMNHKIVNPPSVKIGKHGIKKKYPGTIYCMWGENTERKDKTSWELPNRPLPTDDVTYSSQCMHYPAPYGKKKKVNKQWYNMATNQPS